MSDQFDPYYTWLGIPPQEQPPDHYRLLGLRRFENNTQVIANAVDERKGHVGSFSSGSRAAQSAEILAELAKAAECLLQPDKKGAYDRELRQKDAPKVAKGSPVAKPPAARSSPPTAGEPILASLANPADQGSERVYTWAEVAAPEPTDQPHDLLGNAGSYTPVYNPYTAPHPAARSTGQYAIVAAIALVAVVGLSAMLVGAVVVGGDLLSSKPKPVVSSVSAQPGPFQPVQGRITAPPPRRVGSPRPPPVAAPQGPIQFSPLASDSFNQPASTKFALQFDGVSCVEIENTAELATLARPFTAELWVRWPKDAKGQYLMGTIWQPVGRAPHEQPKPWSGWALGLDRVQGTIMHHHTWDGNNGESQANLVTSAPDDDRWHHFAYSTNGKELDIFFDGQRQVGRQPWRIPAESKSNIFLGAPKDGIKTMDKFRGEICAFRLSSKKRYTWDFWPPATFEKDADTIALLDFSQGSGTTLADLSGQGHAGTIRGAKWVPR